MQSALHMQKIARAVAARCETGEQVVVVVSAMGDMTDRLVEHVSSLTDDPAPRETDLVLASGEQIASALLALAVQDEGCDAIALTGRQAGILTDGRHTRARVAGVHAERIRQELQRGRVVVVAGYQGVSEAGETTTLGRGGSDTTAVVLAGALGARACHIYTDVDGVFTADPRVVPDATLLRTVSYGLMERMARLGAGVLHPGAVAEARKRGVTIHVRRAFSQERGTRVVPDEAPPDRTEARPATAVAGRDDVILVETLTAEDPVPGIVHPDEVLSRVVRGQKQRILVGADGTGLVEDVETRLASRDDDQFPARHVGIVAIVSADERRHATIAAAALDSVGDAGVRVMEQHTQEGATLLVVAPEDVEAATRAAHAPLLKVVPQ